MEIVLTGVAVALVVMYLFLFLRSYWKGTTGLNGELFD